MISPNGSIRIKVIFEALDNIERNHIAVLERSFKRVGSISGVWCGDIAISKTHVAFVIEYKINVKITGVINSLKTNSSRDINNYKKKTQKPPKQPQVYYDDGPVGPMFGFQVSTPFLRNSDINSTEIQTKSYWKKNYSYHSIDSQIS